MPRINIDLPTTLQDKLKQYALDNNIGISEAFNKLARDYFESPTVETKTRQNLFLDEDVYLHIQELAKKSPVKRGNKITPGSKNRIIQEILKIIA